MPSERRRLVQEDPVESQLPDGVSELGEINGLDDIAIDAQTITLDDVPLLFGRGEHHHRYMPGLRIVLDLTQHLQPVHFRELQIQQDHPRAFLQAPAVVGARAEDELQRLGAVSDDMDPVRDVVLPQRTEGQLRVIGIIFN